MKVHEAYTVDMMWASESKNRNLSSMLLKWIGGNSLRSQG
jgi:hypothetical protein